MFYKASISPPARLRDRKAVSIITGWLGSVINMAGVVSRMAIGNAPLPPPLRLAWDDRRLIYVVREPFVSKASAATLAGGVIESGVELIFESQMTDNGLIFSGRRRGGRACVRLRIDRARPRCEGNCSTCRLTDYPQVVANVVALWCASEFD